MFFKGVSNRERPLVRSVEGKCQNQRDKVKGLDFLWKKHYRVSASVLKNEVLQLWGFSLKKVECPLKTR